MCPNRSRDTWRDAPTIGIRLPQSSNANLFRSLYFHRLRRAKKLHSPPILLLQPPLTPSWNMHAQCTLGARHHCRVSMGPELTPSIPGTPSFSSIPIPGTPLSGRASRQSNEGSDKFPLDSSFGRYTSPGTDHAGDQYVQPSPHIVLIGLMLF